LVVIPGIFSSLPDDPDLFITAFGEYTTGAQPSDWTQRHVTGDYTALVQSVAGSFSGKALRWTKTAASRQFLSWDRIPIVADVEILMRYRMIEAAANADVVIAAACRGAGTSGAETAYGSTASYSTSTPFLGNALQRVVAGTSATLGSNLATGAAYTVNSWTWKRFRAIGSSLSHRHWLNGITEPATWLETLTDTNIPAGGWTGIRQISANPDVEIDFFGVALNGKTVPILI
jgi:hypothetical protein